MNTKKRMIPALFLTLFFCMSLIFLPAGAASDFQEILKVYDDASTMTEPTVQMLNEKVETAGKETGLDIVILTKTDETERTAQDYINQTAEEKGLVLFIDFGASNITITPFGDMTDLLTTEDANEILTGVSSDVQSGTPMYDCCVNFLKQVEEKVASHAPTDGLSFKGGTNPGGVDTSKKIYDYAGLLTDEEIGKLSDELIKTGEIRKMDLAIVTTEDTKGRSSMEYADDFYDYNGFGVGDNKDGILLLIDMEHRKAWISTTGRAISVINSNKIDKILDDVTPLLTDKEYYKSCHAFISKTNHYLLDDQSISPQTFLIFLGISIAAGVIGVLILVNANKLVKRGTQAGAYLAGGFSITGQNDTFLRSTVTRTAIPKNTSSSGGGGHVGSSGTSHGGGGRSF